MKTVIINTKSFTLADGTTSQDTIQHDNDFRATHFSLSKDTNNSSTDIWVAVKADGKDFFKSEFVHAGCLKENYGSVYAFKQPIDIRAKTAITIKIKNGTGASLTIEAALHGEDLG